MSSIELFPRHSVVGIFRGFREGGLEFHAELVLPYRSDFHSIPMHGQFILVQLESPDEAVLGRIASFSSEGKLSSGYGEEFNLRAMRDERPVPDDLREEYLKYKVDIRVLGVLRNTGKDLVFVPSHRRLPHVGSHVAFPSDAVLQHIVGDASDGAEIGHFALGEYIYAAGRSDIKAEDWMQVKAPEVPIRFPVSIWFHAVHLFSRAPVSGNPTSISCCSANYMNKHRRSRNAVGDRFPLARSYLIQTANISGPMTKTAPASVTFPRCAIKSSFLPRAQGQVRSIIRSSRAISSSISVDSAPPMSSLSRSVLNGRSSRMCANCADLTREAGKHWPT